MATGKSKNGKPLKKKRFSRIFNWKTFLGLAFVAGTSLGIVIGVYLYYLSVNLEDPKDLIGHKFKLPTIIYDRNDNMVHELYTERRVEIKEEDIPEILKKALIAIEDSRFYNHFGIDPLRIIKAFWINIISGGKVEGASTITQQTAKQFFLTNEKSYERKIKEILLALKMEKIFTKDEILTLYLNKAFFGRRSRGIEAAAEEYFSKSAKNLTVDEAALLVGLLKAPSDLAPTRNPKGAVKRRNLVLQLMWRNSFITREELEIAKARPLKLKIGNRERVPESSYYIEEVRKYLVDKLPDSIEINVSGLKVYTYMDSNLQVYAQNAMVTGLEELQKKVGTPRIIKNIADPEGGETIAEDALLSEISDNVLEPNSHVIGVVEKVNKDTADIRIDKDNVAILHYKTLDWAKNYTGENDENGFPKWAKFNNISEILKYGDVLQVTVKSKDRKTGIYEVEVYPDPINNGGLIAMNPENGEILALSGGYTFSESQFNRAIQSRRQPGSTFKPFVYAAALEKGYTTARILEDNPFTFSNEDGSSWDPLNYNNTFEGYVPFRRALIKSMNIPTIRLLMDIKINYLIDYVAKYGFKSDQFPKNLSIALGSVGLTLEEMVRGYSVFANGGYLVEPKMIRKILDRDGNILVDNTNMNVEREQVLSTGIAFIMTSLLLDVVQNGTGRKARVLERPVAGKTGTTNNYTDAWFMGYVPQLIAGVYVGNDNPGKPIGPYQTGSGAALPIWLDFMKRALKTYPVETFLQPSNIVRQRINSKSGLLDCGNGTSGEDIRFEYFLEGTEPTECYRDKSSADIYNVEIFEPENEDEQL